jgi:hypothetical protein
MSSRQVRIIPRLRADVSYVGREEALEGGLAFWTNDGIPGIQVCSSLLLYFSPSHVQEPPSGRLMHRRNIGPHSLVIKIEIQSESLLMLYTLVDCF